MQGVSFTNYNTLFKKFSLEMPGVSIRVKWGNLFKKGKLIFNS